MKAQHTGVWLYVPATFNIRKFDREYRRLENECHWLLHKILTLHSFYRHDNSKFVNISRQTMQQFIHPCDVDVVRDLLLSNHVIECDGTFVKGGKALGYRLTEEFAGDTRRVEVTKRTLAAKIRVHRIRWMDRSIAEEDLQQVHQHLFHWLRRTQINTDKALMIADQMPDQPKHVKHKRTLGRKGRSKVVNEYISAVNHKSITRTTIHIIANGDWDFEVCPYGRVHTPVTRLLTEVRHCLSIDGQPLVNLDIVNSQMIFFALLLLESRLAGFSGSESIHSDADSNQSSSQVSSSNSNFLNQESKTIQHSQFSIPHTQRSTDFMQELAVVYCPSRNWRTWPLDLNNLRVQWSNFRCRMIDAILPGPRSWPFFVST